jgi:hypothetical protein
VDPSKPFKGTFLFTLYSLKTGKTVLRESMPIEIPNPSGFNATLKIGIGTIIDLGAGGDVILSDGVGIRIAVKPDREYEDQKTLLRVDTHKNPAEPRDVLAYLGHMPGFLWTMALGVVGLSYLFAFGAVGGYFSSFAQLTAPGILLSDFFHPGLLAVLVCENHP